MTGISKSQVSRLCEEIDERVKAFLDRPIEGDWPYLWLDATYVKVRENGRVVSVAVIVAVAVNNDGRREVLGMDIGAVGGRRPSGRPSCASSGQRGLRGVKLVVSDAHEGLKAAVAKVLHASWQRCRVHTIRTQSTVRIVGRSVAAGRWAMQRDDMADLQAVVMDDDALDDELQDRSACRRSSPPRAGRGSGRKRR